MSSSVDDHESAAAAANSSDGPVDQDTSMPLTEPIFDSAAIHHSPAEVPEGFGLSQTEVATSPTGSEVAQSPLFGGMTRKATPTSSTDSIVGTRMSPRAASSRPSRRNTPAVYGIEELIAQTTSKAGSIHSIRSMPARPESNRLPTKDALPRKANSLDPTPARSGIDVMFNDERASDDDEASDEEPGGISLAQESAPGPDPAPSTPPAAKDTDKTTPAEGTPSNSRFAAAKGLLDGQRFVDWVLGRDLPQPEDTPWGDEEYSAPVQQFVEDDLFDIGNPYDICPACTTPYGQAVDSMPFKSSLRLSYNDPEMHEWEIGGKYVMRETYDEHPGDTEVPLVEATKLIRKRTRVPVPNVIAGWKEKGKVLTIAERAPGQCLYEVWWALAEAEREAVARHVAHCVDQWRRQTADRVCNLNGGPVRGHDALFGPGGFGPFRSDAQVWRAIKKRLRARRNGTNSIDPETLRTLREHMPAFTAGCVFTHGDLSCTNVYVARNRDSRSTRVVAITGFGKAASLPAWAEDVALKFCYTPEDRLWKALLNKHLPATYPSALDWWALWTALEDDADPVRVAKLRERCRRWKKTETSFQPPFGSDDADSDEDEDEDEEDEDDGPERHPAPTASQYDANNSHHHPFPFPITPSPRQGEFATGAPSPPRTTLAESILQNLKAASAPSHHSDIIVVEEAQAPDRKPLPRQIRFEQPASEPPSDPAPNNDTGAGGGGGGGGGGGLKPFKMARPVSMFWEGGSSHRNGEISQQQQQQQQQQQDADESSDAAAAAALSSIREDSGSETPQTSSKQEKRRSMMALRNGRAAPPGSIYAAVQAKAKAGGAGAARPTGLLRGGHSRSRSEDRTGQQQGQQQQRAAGAGAKPRPQSLLPTMTSHKLVDWAGVGAEVVAVQGNVEEGEAQGDGGGGGGGAGGKNEEEERVANEADTF
ncbi:hypothetical protein F4780DRAFT_790029 [Xylariomycetidae sp. FL0641]|nr:hypothetical protein F4780DRAFT_790029 [Xylariomycetidae sp. FL0641]